MFGAVSFTPRGRKAKRRGKKTQAKREERKLEMAKAELKAWEEESVCGVKREQCL